MNERHNLIGTIRAGLVPVHWDGHKFVGIGVVVTILLFLLWSPLGWLGVLATGYVAYFFRDPPRVTPVREGLIVAPADGRITSVNLDTPPSEFGLPDQPHTCISIFLSVFDVHINRAPIDGHVVRKIYVPGLYLNAALDKASEDNEREAMVFRADVRAGSGRGPHCRADRQAYRHLGAGGPGGRSGQPHRPHSLRQPCGHLHSRAPGVFSSRKASARSAAKRCSPTCARRKTAAKCGRINGRARPACCHSERAAAPINTDSCARAPSAP